MKNTVKKAAAVMTAIMMLLSFAGCAAAYASAEDLMKGITASKPAEDPQALIKGGAKAADLALRLCKACYEKDKNTLVSPLSVLCALAMTANGAENETLAQMEKVLGMSKEELNSFFLSYMKALDACEGGTLNLANSIWFTASDGFKANPGFLQTNADYFGADLYKTTFDGSETPRKAINSWVNEKTRGMIAEIVDKIPDNIVMYLINALAFEAEWEQIYRKEQINGGVFSNADGSKTDAELMYNEEGMYLQTENAEGFIKNYKNADFAFVALLPKEGSTVRDVIDSLDGETLQKLLASPEYTAVQTAIPRFSVEYGSELSEILKAMGMPDAFSDSKADFSGMGESADGKIYISRVLHKTFISVDGKGTKAGASTAVEISTKGANPNSIKRVYLDRPFVYMLVDRTTDLPFFIGTMENMK